MKKPAAAIGVVVAAISLGIGLTGCGSDSKPTNTSTSTKTSTSTSTKTSTSTSTSAQASGPHQTIDDYLQQNNIQTTIVSHNTAGAPAVNLPVPDGWTLLPESDDAPYGGILFNTPTDSSDAPRIIAVMGKLSGNVDTEKLLAAASGEVKNLPGFSGGDGTRDSLGGFPASQIGGNYTKDGAQRMAVQKTVVIEGKDGIYLLQLSGDSSEADAAALDAATEVIDAQTTITV